MVEELNVHFSSVFTREDTSSLPVPETKFNGSEEEKLGQLISSEFRNAPARNAPNSPRSEVTGAINMQTPADDIRSFTAIDVLGVMHCEYRRFLRMAIVQYCYLTNLMFR